MLEGIAHKSNEMLEEVLSVHHECETENVPQEAERSPTVHNNLQSCGGEKRTQASMPLMHTRRRAVRICFVHKV